MSIDFKEIPPPNKGPERDAFELFARDFFEAMGYTIVKGPGRGPDKGIDLLISEERCGIEGASTFQYTVSCKHLAHTGKAVGEDEQNLIDRVISAGSDGFIGFYSTLASEALLSRLEDARCKSEKFKEFVVYDYAKIQKKLLTNEKTLAVYKQHLRRSFDLNIKQDIGSGVYAREPRIHCSGCGVNLLDNFDGGVFSQFQQVRSAMRDTHSTQLVDLVFACSACKPGIECKISHHSISTYYREIMHYTEPHSFINSMLEGVKFLSFHGNYFESEQVAIKWNRFYRIMFYYVARREVRPERPAYFMSLDYFEL